MAEPIPPPPPPAPPQPPLPTPPFPLPGPTPKRPPQANLALILLFRDTPNEEKSLSLQHDSDGPFFVYQGFTISLKELFDVGPPPAPPPPLTPPAPV